MKKILILFLLLSLPIISHSKLKFRMKVFPINAIKNGKNYTLSFNVRYKNIPKLLVENTPLIISTEDMLVHGKIINRTLKERNFLFAKLNVDLNGDNDFNDSFKAIYYRRNYYINNKKIHVLSSNKMVNNLSVMKYLSGSKLSTSKISDNGKEILVYLINSFKQTTVVGFNRSKKSVSYDRFPNPAVQLMVIKTTESIQNKPTYSISGYKNYLTYSNDKVFDGQGDDWVTIQWMVKKIDLNKNGISRFTFTVTNITPPFAVIVIGNISVGDGIRLRSRPSVKIVK